MQRVCLFFLIFIFPALAVDGGASGFGESLFYAQAEAEEQTDVYDPFLNYTEFEDSEEEREDILFFKTGRFISLAALVGGRLFTGSFLSYYTPNLSFGLSTSIFFNLEFALEVYGLFSYHPVLITHAAGTVPFEGFFSQYAFGANIVYHIKREKLIKAFAVLNPYFFTGTAVHWRQFQQVNQTVLNADLGSEPYISVGGKLGAGIEFHISKQIYIALQADFEYITFQEESSETVRLSNRLNTGFVDTGIILWGDVVNLLLVGGINF